MPGFDDLLNFVFRAADVAPAYAEKRCLVVVRGRSACRACLDACPHDAVRIGRRVEIDRVDCTGCGLCVQACPSQALEASPRYEPGASIRCSKVPGEAQSVLCLARLSPTDILRLGGRHEEVALVHGECAGCAIGSEAVPDVVNDVAEAATALAAARGRPLRVRVEAKSRFDGDRRPDRVSRRSLLTGGLRDVQRSASAALEPLERILPVPKVDDERAELPAELTKRHFVLELAALAADASVPWRLPRVADGCILCPSCTRACPTDAFSRDLAADPAVLYLDPERCVGCDACVDACPVRVITMVETASWGELSGGRAVAYRADPERRAPGSQPR